MTPNNFNGMINDVSLYMVMKAFQQETFAKLNCMKIGIIDEILGGGKVKCSITNKKLMSTNTDGTSVWKEYPPIFARVYYMGSGGNSATYPLVEGSPCLLFFNDREFESFFKTGQVSPLSNTQMHSLSYCMCVPLSLASATDDFVISSSGEIHLDSSKVVAQSELSAQVLKAETAATGSFVSQDGKTITVTKGIVTSIV